MDKEQREAELMESFGDFVAEYPNSAMAMITGMFVGVVAVLVEREGGDPSKEIKIDGQGSRNITIHAAGV